MPCPTTATKADCRSFGISSLPSLADAPYLICICKCRLGPRPAKPPKSRAALWPIPSAKSFVFRSAVITTMRLSALDQEMASLLRQHQDAVERLAEVARSGCGLGAVGHCRSRCHSGDLSFGEAALLVGGCLPRRRGIDQLLVKKCLSEVGRLRALTNGCWGMVGWGPGHGGDRVSLIASMLYQGPGRSNRAFTLISCQVFPLVAAGRGPSSGMATKFHPAGDNFYWGF
ncbi:MAG: hypothetical protein JWN63_3676 [Candidatus Acidoferrum typicum]|nr:hypothetical protein [Candidatus Acidoferrum typicum]